MLAPLLLGTGIMFRSIRANASLIFPRIGVMVVLLWMLWFINSVVQNTVYYLRRQACIAALLFPLIISYGEKRIAQEVLLPQGALDARLSGAVITASECMGLLAAMVIILSMIGVNVSALLLPAAVALAYAAKDLSHNFLAGLLFLLAPFHC